MINKQIWLGAGAARIDAFFMPNGEDVFNMCFLCAGNLRRKPTYVFKLFVFVEPSVTLREDKLLGLVHCCQPCLIFVRGADIPLPPDLTVNVDDCNQTRT